MMIWGRRRREGGGRYTAIRGDNLSGRRPCKVVEEVWVHDTTSSAFANSERRRQLGRWFPIAAMRNTTENIR